MQKILEDARATKTIGSSLQAEVELRAGGERLALLQSLGDDLRYVLITSSARVAPASDDGAANAIAAASVHPKCERCWHYRADVGTHTTYSDICGRCAATLEGVDDPRRFA